MPRERERWVVWDFRSARRERKSVERVGVGIGSEGGSETGGERMVVTVRVRAEQETSADEAGAGQQAAGMSVSASARLSVGLTLLEVW